jgi:hypothetical protein
MREMVRMNLILNTQRTMELELPNIDAKNGQIHGNLLTDDSVDQSDRYELLPLRHALDSVRSSPTARAARAPI